MPLSPLVFEQVGIMAGIVKKEMEKNPEIRKLAGLFSQRLDAIQKMGRVPGIGQPAYILLSRNAKAIRPWSCSHLRTAWKICG